MKKVSFLRSLPFLKNEAAAAESFCMSWRFFPCFFNEDYLHVIMAFRQVITVETHFLLLLKIASFVLLVVEQIQTHTNTHEQ